MDGKKEFDGEVLDCFAVFMAERSWRTDDGIFLFLYNVSIMIDDGVLGGSFCMEIWILYTPVGRCLVL